VHKQCERMSAAEVAQLLNVTPGYVVHKLLRPHVLRPVFCIHGRRYVLRSTAEAYYRRRRRFARRALHELGRVQQEAGAYVMDKVSNEIPEPLVDTRVRVYAEKLRQLWQQHNPHPAPACEGRSIQLDGSAWEQCITALRSRHVRGPFPLSDAITVLIVQQTTSGPHVMTTWRVDIEIRGRAAYARVHSTLPRIDLGPIPVETTDDVVAVAIKVLEGPLHAR
jgi:hypothetical protein